MNSSLKYAFNYIRYFLVAKHKKGHGVHSPFVFNLITNVFRNNSINSELKTIYKIHDKYSNSRETIQTIEIGAKSNYKNTNKIPVGKVIERSSVNKKYGKLLYNLAKYFSPKDSLEIGSSVGISAAYIAQAVNKTKFISLEGNESKITIAKNIANELKHNTKFIYGNFDTVLASVVDNFEKLDFVFFDGNHKKKNTLEYFNICLNKAHNETIFIFDDIHWSEEMEEAWEEIKKHPKVRVSIDLFRMGLIFFRRELSYEHYVIKF